jgi:hypothetical protein
LIVVSTVTSQPYDLRRPVLGISQALHVLFDEEILRLCIDLDWEHGSASPFEVKYLYLELLER